MTLRAIPIDKIVPNDFNPNEMSEEAFAEYCAEVRHLGRLPKPTVVRRRKDGTFEIVDGEYGWLAAMKVGLTAIDCEVIDADDFEAMRQCYKRNRGGEDNPLLLGQMFQRMLHVEDSRTGKRSVRQLAKIIDMPEATIRSYLQYPKAFGLRKHCAPEEQAAEDVGNMTFDQVRMFNRLGDLANAWFDSGADLRDVYQDPPEIRYEMVVDYISHSRIAEYARPDDFRQSMRDLFELASWSKQHQQINRVEAYTRPVAKRQMPCAVMECLPCREVSDAEYRVLITVKQWAKLLQQCRGRYNDEVTLCQAVKSGVRKALGANNVDLADVEGPIVAEMVQAVDAAPACITELECAALEEKYWLLQRLRDGDDALIEEAVERTCQRLRHLRVASTNGKPRKRRPVSVPDVFQQQYEAIVDECDDAFFAEGVELLRLVVEALSGTEAMRDSVIGDKPAIDVLAQRLDELDLPELHLVASLVLSAEDVEHATARWVKATRNPTIDIGDQE